jgi:hypothetical protein
MLLMYDRIGGQQDLHDNSAAKGSTTSGEVAGSSGNKNGGGVKHELGVSKTSIMQVNSA